LLVITKIADEAELGFNFRLIRPAVQRLAFLRAAFRIVLALDRAVVTGDNRFWRFFRKLRKALIRNILAFIRAVFRVGRIVPAVRRTV
jgi:hypothetical protein